MNRVKENETHTTHSWKEDENESYILRETHLGPEAFKDDGRPVHGKEIINTATSSQLSAYTVYIYIYIPPPDICV